MKPGAVIMSGVASWSFQERKVKEERAEAMIHQSKVKLDL